MSKKSYLFKHFFCAFLLVSSFSLFGQPAAEDSREELNIFMDCKSCDMNFLREKISYVNYVRDPELADIHILVTSQRNAANGQTFTFDFIGKGAFEANDLSLTYNQLPDAQQQQRREGMAEKIELGLIPYWIKTSMVDEIDVDIASLKTSSPVKKEEDQWNNWIFEISGGGSFSKESSRSAISVWGSLRANRVTEKWRIRNRAYLRYDEKVFKQPEEEDIVSTSHRNFVSSSTVKSIDHHWSAGLFSSIRQSTYDNLDLGVNLAPALEYSIFPYQEVNRREVTIAYRMGYLYRDYEVLTIYQQLNEALWNQAIVVAARIQQPWGSIFAGIEGSHLMDDFSQNRLELDGNISLRVTSGLSLWLGGDIAFINDQRSLPAGETSLEDLLLAQTQLATDYRMSGSIGLKYTFGSMFNNVVNTRL